MRLDFLMAIILAVILATATILAVPAAAVPVKLAFLAYVVARSFSRFCAS